MKIIAVNGTIGSGKDTFSSTFIQDGYQRFSFAESLKDSVALIFGWDREMLEGSTVESRKQRETIDEYWSLKLGRDVTPRWVLQNFGTEVIRKNFDDNIWVYSLEKKLISTKSEKIIITDCRFKNEINMIRSLGGILIEIQRDLPEWYNLASDYNTGVISTLPSELENIHSSEYSWIGINKPDYTIRNNGTINDLSQLAQCTLFSINKM